jgi:DNA-binding PadR family transcriptional regulator
MGILARFRLQRRLRHRLRVQHVLQAIRDGHHYGLAIMEYAKVSAGRLYPILVELERDGLVTSEWEHISPQAEGRPRRRLYRAT